VVAPTTPNWVRGRARRFGYRLLGPQVAYLLHTRPAEWPIMAAHTALGYLLAVGLGGARNGVQLGAAMTGLVAWVVCLNGGTLAVNSAFDRDEGDIAYLREPPPPPQRLFVFGLLLMAFGLGVAARLPRGFTTAYTACFLMSLAYSVPPLRLKAVAGADWVINMLGFGTLTPYAGWAATGVPLDSARLVVLLAFCPLFAALYPLTQLYQFEEDRRRGDNTLGLRLGVRGSLIVSQVGCIIAFALFALAGVSAGWRWGGGGTLRWVGVLAAFGAWTAVLAAWTGRQNTMTASDHQRGMYFALAAWALTDLVVVLAWGT
jgi:4-hydroxybenzoate polyprenyltransferase